MKTLVNLLALLTTGALPLCGYTQPPPVTWADGLALSHSIDEAVELLVLIRPRPPIPQEDAIVSVNLTLLDDPNPYVSNVAAGEYSLPGVIRIKIQYSATQRDDTACLLVSVGQRDTEWCGLTLDTDRVSYAVSGSATAGFPWGGDIPIIMVDSPTATVFDRASGKTVSIFLINGIKLQGIL